MSLTVSRSNVTSFLNVWTSTRMAASAMESMREEGERVSKILISGRLKVRTTTIEPRIIRPFTKIAVRLVVETVAGPLIEIIAGLIVGVVIRVRDDCSCCWRRHITRIGLGTTGRSLRGSSPSDEVFLRYYFRDVSDSFKVRGTYVTCRKTRSRVGGRSNRSMCRKPRCHRTERTGPECLKVGNN